MYDETENAFYRMAALTISVDDAKTAIEVDSLYRQIHDELDKIIRYRYDEIRNGEHSERAESLREARIRAQGGI